MKPTAIVLSLIAWIFAPLLFGIINRIKSFFGGRKGPALLQPYYDLYKLLNKASVYGRSTGPVLRFAPYVVLACMIVCTLFVPWGGLAAPLSFAGDIVLLVYLLGLARFATVLAALDTGSSFEGMGASREVQFAVLAEPAFLLGMLVLILHSGQLGVSEIMSAISPQTWHSSAIFPILVACSWFIVLLAENSRIPVDDPNTHLELTMIHEVMVLDYSGPDMAAIHYAASLKLWIFGALLVNLFLPLNSVAPWLRVPAFLAGMACVAVLVGLVESAMARLRLHHVPKMLLVAAALSLIALIAKMTG